MRAVWGHCQIEQGALTTAAGVGETYVDAQCFPQFCVVKVGAW